MILAFSTRRMRRNYAFVLSAQSFESRETRKTENKKKEEEDEEREEEEKEGGEEEKKFAANGVSLMNAFFVSGKQRRPGPILPGSCAVR